MRGLGIGLIIVLQSFSQLEELYGMPMRKILLTNCGTQLLLPGAGLEETRFYSERIGDTTVQTTSSTTRGTGFLTQDRTFTTSETRRRLYTPEELRTMGQNQMLVLGSAAAPIMVTTKSYEHDRVVRHLADQPFPHATVRPEPYTSPTPTSSSSTPPPTLGGPGSGATGPQQKQKPAGSTIIVDADDDSGLAPE